MRDEQELEAVAKLAAESSPDSNTVLADDTNLNFTHVRLPVSQYLAEMWRYRKFTVANARFRASADNDDMFLGRFWTVLEPLLRIAMYGTIFGLLLNTSRGIDNFLGFLVLGLTFFSMMSRGLGNGAGLIQRSRAMMRTFKFPRASLVVGESLRGFFSNLIPAGLAVLAALAFQFGEPLHWTIIFVVPLILFMNIFALGLSFFTARITAFLPDAKKVVFFVNRAWFYVSGVFFSIERYDSVPELQRVMMLNPAYEFLKSIRGATMYGTAPTWEAWALMIGWSLGTLVLGFLFFWAAEEKYVHVK